MNNYVFTVKETSSGKEDTQYFLAIRAIDIFQALKQLKNHLEHKYEDTLNLNRSNPGEWKSFSNKTADILRINWLH